MAGLGWEARLLNGSGVLRKLRKGLWEIHLVALAWSLPLKLWTS